MAKSSNVCADEDDDGANAVGCDEVDFVMIGLGSNVVDAAGIDLVAEREEVTDVERPGRGD